MLLFLLIPLYGFKKTALVITIIKLSPSFIYSHTGGWNRLQNRLIANGLGYPGEKVKSAAAIKGIIEELKAVCEQEGVDLATATFPQKCMPYARLVEDLEKLKVLRSVTIETIPSLVSSDISLDFITGFK